MRATRAVFTLMLVPFGACLAAEKVHTQSGVVEGAASADGRIRIFKGIPFAAPPVGDLRWQPPQPVSPWAGVRKATEFGARCMQGRIYEDMVFRDPGPSEDCLYLNVWTPGSSAEAGLPVMVWIYGGGFQAGSASEPRQDGENLAKKGVIVVSLNYRLGVFGFFSHPELTKESPHHASGNYGLLDQVAALEWVHKNIAAFGGNPDNVTIFGESAGSISVSAQMASPLSKGLLKQAIGQSGGAFMLTPRMPSVSETQQTGAEFAKSLGVSTLHALRAMPADQVLKAALKDKTKTYRFWPNVDGYFFPQTPAAIYAAGKQAHVALLGGWNADEHDHTTFLETPEATKENYAAKVRAEYGRHADEVLTLYAGTNQKEMKESARDLASDQFIAYSTWKWLDMQLATGESPVYRYHFEQAPPTPTGEPDRGAYHSADIEYVFETLDWKRLPWTADDRKLSDIISSYWTNFAKRGNPNGPGLPEWPSYSKTDHYAVMHLQVGGVNNGEKGRAGSQEIPYAAPDPRRPRYKLLDRIADERAEKHKSSAMER
ncbi:MAG: carboxylesterase/lipase family protein [Bryobacteraceae bacterium]